MMLLTKVYAYDCLPRYTRFELIVVHAHSDFAYHGRSLGLLTKVY
jgi:hypothetical protein